jgi:hypothetical protein
MSLKMINLPKHLEHFPHALDIRGKSWSRVIITGEYAQAQMEEKRVNNYGLYKSVIVKKEYPKKPGYVAGNVYGVYQYPLKTKLGK